MRVESVLTDPPLVLGAGSLLIMTEAIVDADIPAAGEANLAEWCLDRRYRPLLSPTVLRRQRRPADRSASGPGVAGRPVAKSPDRTWAGH